MWIGDCLIREAADGTDTYELNRNLVLTEGAKADSVPTSRLRTAKLKVRATRPQPVASTTSSSST